MFVKLLVFQGQGGFDGVIRNVRQLNQGSLLFAVNVIEQMFAGPVVDFGALGHATLGQLVGVRQVFGQPGHQADH